MLSRASILLLITVLIISCYESRSQDYKPVRDSGSVFFLKSDKTECACRIDSITRINSQTIYYFNRTWNVYDYPCIQPYHPVFIGLKCVLADSSAYFFYNKNGDSIRINVLLADSNKWMAFRMPDSSYYEGSIIQKDFESFLGISDSVETIKFTLMSAAGLILSNAENTYYLKISKHYGIISGFSFLDFPETKEEFELFGLTRPELGKTFLTEREVFNYALNDEFHVEVVYSTPPTGTGTFSNQIRKVIGKIISANTDTVLYVFSVLGKYDFYDWSNGNHSTTYKTDTLYEKHIFVHDSVYLYLPQEAISYRGAPFSNYDLAIDTHCGLRILSPSSAYYIQNGSNCWNMLLYDPAQSTAYMEGCGLLFEDADDLPAQTHTKLLYFKKGQLSWGTPLVINGIQNEQVYYLKLFPNPVKQGNELQFVLPVHQTYQLTVYAITGEKLKEISGTGSNSLVYMNTTELKSGIYILSVKLDGQIHQPQKFIIN